MVKNSTNCRNVSHYSLTLFSNLSSTRKCLVGTDLDATTMETGGERPQLLSAGHCMLYNGLEWDKRVLTSLDHERQLYNTVIPPSHQSRAVGLRISRLSGSVG